MGNVPKLFSANNFEGIKDTSQFNEDFMKIYNEQSNEEYFLKVEFQYTEKLKEPHIDLPFSLERMKIEKFGKLAHNLHEKAEDVIHIRNLKQELNHGLDFFFLKKI